MKKTDNKKNNIKSKSKKDLDVEIATKLKSLGKPLNVEVSELEEELTENADEDIDETLRAIDFDEPMRSIIASESRAPVLERIAGSGPRPIFVNTSPQRTQTDGDSSVGGDGTNYISSNKEANEPKYEGSSEIYREPEKINTNEVGRNQRNMTPESRREVAFTPSVEAMSQSSSVEKVRRVDMFEAENSRQPRDRAEADKENYRMKYKR